MGDAELPDRSGTSPEDLLCAPVPSSLPSPQLHPDPVLLQHQDFTGLQKPSLTQLLGNVIDPQPIHHQPHIECCSTADVANSDIAVDNHEDCDAGSVVIEPTQSLATENPSKRSFRNKFKLAANFSYSPAPHV